MSCCQPPGCEPSYPVNILAQAIRDALAERIIELQGYRDDAKQSADSAHNSALASAQSAYESGMYREQTQDIFNSAQELVPRIGQVAADLQETAETIENIARNASSYTVVNYYYTTVGGETLIVIPEEMAVLTVQAIYIEGVRQDSGYGFSYESSIRTITLAEPIPEDAVGLVLTIQLGQTNVDSPETVLSALAKPSGAGLVTTLSGQSVQKELDDLKEFDQDQTEALDLVNSNLTNFQANLAKPDGRKYIGEVASFAALRALVPSAPGIRVVLRGYYQNSTLGGGDFISESVTLPDDGGIVASNGGNYIWRRVGITEVTPYMFGALGNKTNDDTNAISKAMTSGYPVFIPAGQYLVTNTMGLKTSTVGVSVRGSGDQSVLWYGAVNATMNLVGDGAKVSNVWFRSQVPGVGTYITLGDINAVIETNGATVENCLFGDEQTTNYAIHSIRCFNLWYSTIRGNHFRGIGNGTATVNGIYSYYSVNISCTDNTFLFMGRCIVWDATAAPAKGFHNEGWLIGNNAAAGIYSFFAATNGLAVHINNNIIDICFGPAIYSDAGTTRLTDNWIAAQDTNTQPYLVYLSGGFSVVHTNRFVGQVGIATCLQIGGSPEHMQIQDNSFFGCGTAVSVGTAATYMVFSGNTALSQTVRCWDLSRSTYMTYYGNTFRNSASATFPLPLVAITGNNLIKRQWTTTVSASLSSGNSGQDFTVALPPGLFSDKPLCQATLSSGTTGLVVAYVYDSSNTSTATIRVMNPTGSAIPSGTYRFCLTFTDQTF